MSSWRCSSPCPLSCRSVCSLPTSCASQSHASARKSSTSRSNQWSLCSSLDSSILNAVSLLIENVAQKNRTRYIDVSALAHGRATSDDQHDAASCTTVTCPTGRCHPPSRLLWIPALRGKDLDLRSASEIIPAQRRRRSTFRIRWLRACYSEAIRLREFLPSFVWLSEKVRMLATVTIVAKFPSHSTYTRSPEPFDSGRRIPVVKLCFQENDISGLLKEFLLTEKASCPRV